MIITISGVPGSGKSTVARLVAARLGLKHYSAGDFMREIAARRGLSLLEISRIAESDRSIDRELDERTVRLGKSEDGFVIDSRLAFHFIPDSFKVFLAVDESEAARRICSDVKKKAESRKVEKESTTEASTLAAIRERKKSEELRYREYYGINPYDVSHYNLVINTTESSPDAVAGRIVGEVKKRKHNATSHIP